MTIAGQTSGSDFFKNIVTKVIKFIKRKKQHSAATCDGLVLKMHYQYTFWLFLGVFSTAWYSWYHKESLVCISRFNADAKVRSEHINLCLSYNSYTDPVDGHVKNIMFYKWLPFSLLVLAFVYYIPRKISKSLENIRTSKLVDQIASTQSNFHEKSENSTVQTVVEFLESNQGLQNGLFYNYLLCNFLALVLNSFCIFALNFFMQGRFLTYGIINILTLYRDPVNFTDAISRTFPPFTLCRITPIMQLTADRTEEYGCHLTHMELYEKIFFFLWWWLMILLLSTVAYLIFLTLIFLAPGFRIFLLKFSKTDEAREEDFKVRATLRNLLSKCSIGDVYLLHRIKQITSSRMFWKIISSLDSKIIDRKEEEKEENYHSNVMSVSILKEMKQFSL